ncbi:hypothetical protein, partial [Stenotrophomonas maltophilia]|uniref:hypothetical protein n=1 Tax=Stenotrophomonas maltophilia TaxID=40324 RepID=UPI0019546850
PNEYSKYREMYRANEPAGQDFPGLRLARTLLEGRSGRVLPSSASCRRCSNEEQGLMTSIRERNKRLI